MDLTVTTTTFRREAAAVPAARAFVRRALVSEGATPDAAERLVLAASEAMNNVIVHASGRAFAVDVSVDRAACVVSVSDSGLGFSPPRRPAMASPDELGHRGVALMHLLVDRVDVTTSPAGTTVMLTQHLAPALVPAAP